jgi:hypothetical protein
VRDRLAVFLLVHGACTYPNPAFNVDTNGSGTGGSSIAEDGTVSTTDPTIGSTGGSTGGATGGSTGGLTGGLTGGSTGGSTGDSPTTDPCDSAACVCEPGLVEPCYEGPPGSEDVGECIAGTRVCARDGGAWGPCNDAVEPTPEVCDNGLDDNCDDALDESSCEGSCPVMDGLVACYLFPEGETSQLVDGSGNGHHGAMSAVELVDGAPQQGKAGQFSARSQAQIPNDEAFNPALFTIAMLAAPSPAAGEVTLVDKADRRLQVWRSRIDSRRMSAVGPEAAAKIEAVDVLVVGAGFGGLGAAMGLVERGAKRDGVRAARLSGGCAGTFTRGGCRYDAGATLSSGFGPGPAVRGWAGATGWTLPQPARPGRRAARAGPGAAGLGGPRAVRREHRGARGRPRRGGAPVLRVPGRRRGDAVARARRPRHAAAARRGRAARASGEHRRVPPGRALDRAAR